MLEEAGFFILTTQNAAVFGGRRPVPNNALKLLPTVFHDARDGIPMTAAYLYVLQQVATSLHA